MATWEELNKQYNGTNLSTQKTTKSWNDFNAQMKKQAIQQESQTSGIDKALFAKLKEKGIGTSEISKLEPEKVSYLKTFGKETGATLKEFGGQMLRDIRASSQLLATPLAGAIALVPGGATPKEAMRESLKMAKNTLINKKVSIDKGVEDAAKMWLKNRGVGKYGGKDPDIADVAALGVLGFFNLFGDPAFEYGAGLKGAKALKEFATFKKVGEVAKELPEGVNILKGTGIPREIKITEDLKIKVKPTEKEVVFEGYKRRFPTQKALPDNQMAKETQDLVVNTREATGMELQAKFIGDDLVMKPTTPIIKTIQPVVKAGERMYKIIKEEGIKEVKGTPVKIVDGVDTFIHEGTGGWVVSEATTGRYLADSRTKDGAIAKAKFEISNVGEKKFKQLILEKQLTQTTKEDPLIKEAKKYKSAEEFVKAQGIKDFQEKVIAGQDLGSEIGKKVNPDGTITLYHGTSKQNANNILKSGQFNEGTYFSVKKGGTEYGDSPLDVAKRKFGKDAEVIEVKVDARDLESAAAGSEVFTPKKLIKQADGSWASESVKTKSQLTDIWNKAQETNVLPKKETEIKKSKLGLRVKEEAVKEGLVKQMRGLPEYETMNMKEQAQLASNLINSDFEKAKRVAMGQEILEGKLLPESIFIAMKNWAKQNKDVALIRQLAKSHTVEQTTFMGQRIRALGETDPNDPVKIIREIGEARAKKAKITKRELSEEERKIQAEIKRVRKTEQDLEDFINSIVC